MNSDNKKRDLIISMVSPVIILVFWEMLSRANLVDRRFLPPPTAVAVALFKTIQDGVLFVHIKSTLFRVLVGFVMGAFPGIVIGVVMGLSNVIRAFVRPLIVVSYPIPKIALFPLVMLFFGLGEVSNVIIVAVGVFFPVLYNTLGGVTTIPRIYWDVAANFGARRFRLFRTVAIPGALPSIFTGLELGIGMALITAVVTEYMGSREGLGFMIWFAWQVFSVSEMFVGLITISAIGFVLTFALDRIRHLIIPWKV